MEIADEAKDEKFASILKVASILDCTAIEKFALRHFEGLGELQNILIGRRYSVRSLFLRGITALCDREEFLTLEEAEKSQLKDVVQITRIREKLRAGAVWEDEEMWLSL